MEAITKSFLTLFCLLMVTFTTVGLIVGAVNAGKADAFLTDAVKGVEESNLRDTAIREWQSMAKSLNYQLDCKSMDTNGDGYTDMVDMTLVYNYILPYVKAGGQKHQLRAYAR